MQPISRHLFWGAAKRDMGGMASYQDDAKLGFPTALVKPKPSITPVVLLVARIDGPTDEAVPTDLTKIARGAAPRRQPDRGRCDRGREAHRGCRCDRGRGAHRG